MWWVALGVQERHYGGLGFGSSGTGGEFGACPSSLKKLRSLELRRQTQGIREKIEKSFDSGVVKI